MFNCNITVKLVQKKIRFFNTQAHNPSQALIESAKNNVDLTALQQKLAPNYALLSEIIDYKNSPNCLQKGECDLGGKVGEYSIKRRQVGQNYGLYQHREENSQCIIARALMLGKPGFRKFANGRVD